jgi:hypothetical protein
MGQPREKAEVSHQQTTISPSKVTQFTDSPVNKEKRIKVYASIHYYRHPIIVLTFPAARRLDLQPCPNEIKKAECQLNYFTIPKLRFSR